MGEERGDTGKVDGPSEECVKVERPSYILFSSSHPSCRICVMYRVNVLFLRLGDFEL